MTLHQKANNKLLKGEFLTIEALNEKQENGQTVWHCAAWWHSLKDIPESLFNEYSLNLKDDEGGTVWHNVAIRGNLKYIPKHLFTNDALAKVDQYGRSVWHYIAQNQTIRDVPEHLITKDLLDIQFNEDDKAYITNIAELPGLLNKFIIENSILAKDIEHHDPRLKLIDVKNNTLFFSFEGIKDEITLSKNRFNSLGDVVSFIEQTYPNIEKSLVLPKSKASNVDEFVL